MAAEEAEPAQDAGSDATAVPISQPLFFVGRRLIRHCFVELQRSSRCPPTPVVPAAPRPPKPVVPAVPRPPVPVVPAVPRPPVPVVPAVPRPPVPVVPAVPRPPVPVVPAVPRPPVPVVPAVPRPPVPVVPAVPRPPVPVVPAVPRAAVPVVPAVPRPPVPVVPAVPRPPVPVVPAVPRPPVPVVPAVPRPPSPVVPAVPRPPSPVVPPSRDRRRRSFPRYRCSHLRRWYRRGRWCCRPRAGRARPVFAATWCSEREGKRGAPSERQQQLNLGRLIMVSPGVSCGVCGGHPYRSSKNIGSIAVQAVPTKIANVHRHASDCIAASGRSGSAVMRADAVP